MKSAIFATLVVTAMIASGCGASSKTGSKVNQDNQASAATTDPIKFSGECRLSGRQGTDAVEIQTFDLEWIDQNSDAYKTMSFSVVVSGRETVFNVQAEILRREGRYHEASFNLTTNQLTRSGVGTAVNNAEPGAILRGIKLNFNKYVLDDGDNLVGDIECSGVIK
jgi:hypothetical protein